MSKSSSSLSCSGTGFIGLLTIVFITLKLLGVIEWSWLAVLSPVLTGCLFSITVIVGALVLGFFIGVRKELKIKGE